MEDVERALAGLDTVVSDSGASPSERRVVHTLQGTHGLARLDLERRLVSRAACDALAELQMRLDVSREQTERLHGALREAKAETEKSIKERSIERKEWIQNRNAVRTEIKLARDRVQAVKEEHRHNLIELDRERGRTNSAVEETAAANEETNIKKNEIELLKKRLARARIEIAKCNAEIAARDDLMDTALAANAKNAAIAARDAFKRRDEEWNGKLNDLPSDDDDGDFYVASTSAVNPSAPPSPSGPFAVSQSVKNTHRASSSGSFSFRPGKGAQKMMTVQPPVNGSRADWARAYTELVGELEKTRAKCSELEKSSFQAKQALSEERKGKRASGKQLYGTVDEKTVGANSHDAIAELKTRASDAETRASNADATARKLASLNASLLDRYGEVLHGNGYPSGSVTQEPGRALFRDDEESKSSSFTEIDTHLSVAEKIQKLEDEVKRMDTEYRTVVETIRAEHAEHIGTEPGSSAPHVLRAWDTRADELAARANQLEDGIVARVEEIQRLKTAEQ